MRYELYYWPSIQGRGEFIRLPLEEAAAEYVDVARLPARRGLGMPALMRLLGDAKMDHPPFAPPILKAGKRVISQTANILLFLGLRLGLAPRAEAERAWAHQLQLTITDWLVEVHDTHHPIAGSLYYEEQRAEARQRAAAFTRTRLPKFLGYFERLLEHSRGNYLLRNRLSYVDLSLFQMIAGLRYAFPRVMARLARKHPALVALHDRVAARPRIAAYLASARRVPFSTAGIFRHYPELDK